MSTQGTMHAFADTFTSVNSWVHVVADIDSQAAVTICNIQSLVVYTQITMIIVLKYVNIFSKLIVRVREREHSGNGRAIMTTWCADTGRGVVRLPIGLAKGSVFRGLPHTRTHVVTSHMYRVCATPMHNVLLQYQTPLNHVFTRAPTGVKHG